MRTIVNVKEFMLIFYGASNCTGSQRVAEALNALIYNFNHGNGEYELPKHLFDLLYISNDPTAETLDEFI